MNNLLEIEKDIELQIKALDKSLDNLWNLMCKESEFESKQIARDIRSNFSGFALHNLKQTKKDLRASLVEVKKFIKKEEN